MRPSTRIASNEWPPSSRKLSVTPTSCFFSTSAQMRAIVASVGVRGATIVALGAAVASGAGSARVSILPFAVSGSASSSTTALGTMYSGSCAASHSPSFSIVGRSLCETA